MLETLVQGVLLGGLYTLFALGQSLMFGVMRLTNTAQGDFIILGAFSVIAGVSLTGDAAPWLVALAVLPVAFGFGYALQRYVLNGTLGKDPLPSLVVTFGLSIVIQNLLLELFSADPRSIETGGNDLVRSCVRASHPTRHLARVLIGSPKERKYRDWFVPTLFLKRRLGTTRSSCLSPGSPLLSCSATSSCRVA